MTTCPRCSALNEALQRAEERNGELASTVTRLESELVELQAQLAEMGKLCELQQADLDRYKKAYEASRPNHPERAPKEQLQLAFERVLESLGVQAPANDDGAAEASGSLAEAATGQGRNARPTRRHPHGRRKLDLTALPVVEIKIVPDEVKAAGGKGFELVDQEVSDRVGRRPAEWIRIRVIRLKYVPSRTLAEDTDGAAAETPVRGDEGDDLNDVTSGDDGRRITIAPLPSGMWPNVMGDPSAIAHVILSKYEDLLPLNRQQTISARTGFMLPKSTQCGWLKTANGFCAPVVDAMFEDSKRGAFLIATDATGAPVLPPRVPPGAPKPQLTPGERRRCESWHVYVFIADRDHVVFRYHREHTGAVFEKLLEGYHGNLLADAASVFDVLYREHGMTEHACWFHCRRPFYRALQSDPMRAFEALSLISKLFEVERELRAEPLDLDTFTRIRRERAEPILKLLDEWIALNRGRIDPRSPLDSAIGYYDNQREALRRFLNDGRIRLDNNLSEQALRKLVVGLSNWVFFANESGIAWYTTFRSLIASCLLHDLNPEIYLEQLLRLVPHWPRHRVLELAPKYWLDTVARLEPSWRSILARPWEPDVILSADTRRGREAPMVQLTSSRAA
jgi:transposase